jgi:hypothetical protein
MISPLDDEVNTNLVLMEGLLSPSNPLWPFILGNAKVKFKYIP